MYLSCLCRPQPGDRMTTADAAKGGDATRNFAQNAEQKKKGDGNKQDRSGDCADSDPSPSSNDGQLLVGK